MSFLNLAFLWGLPLLAVPVAIHLLNRRRQEVVRWGAMQLLLTSSIRRRRIWRLDDLLLMLLRTLAILALVLALARPLWHGAGLGGGASRDVLFVCDVSLSTGRTVGDTSAFDKIVEKTEELLGRLGPSDTLRGLVTIGRGEWLIPEAASATGDRRAQLLDALKWTGITEATADWHACLSTALRAAPPTGRRGRVIVVVSDGQAAGWRDADQTGWQNLARIVDESTIPTSIEFYNAVGDLGAASNLAVEKLSTPRHLLGTGEAFTVDAEVRNHGKTPIDLGTIEWSLDGVSLGKSTVGPLGAGQSARGTLRHIAGKPGVSRLACRLETTDALGGDNERSLILETIDHVPVLLVDDSREADPLKSDRGYVLAALGQDKSGAATVKSAKGENVFLVTTIATDELRAQNLSGFRAILFPNTPDLDDAALGRLTDFVRHGGGLWLALGDRTSPDEFNRQLYRVGAGLAPWPIEPARGDAERREEFAPLHPPAKEHPATVLLGDTERLDIDRAKVFRHFPFVAAPGRGEIPVLLQTGEGMALAVEGFFGRGRVIVQSIPMGVRWSNLPLMQAYVPLVHEWLWYLIQPTGVALNLRPGEPLQVLLPPNEHVREVQLHAPGGREFPLVTFQQGDRLLAQSRQTQRPGGYEAVIEVEGKPDEVRPYQVARDSEESNLDGWTPQMKARWNDLSGFRLQPTDPLALRTDGVGRTTGEPLWGKLLAVVVLSLLVELWFVRRIAARRFGLDGAMSGASAPGTGRFASAAAFSGTGGGKD